MLTMAFFRVGSIKRVRDKSGNCHKDKKEIHKAHAKLIYNTILTIHNEIYDFFDLTKKLAGRRNDNNLTNSSNSDVIWLCFRNALSYLSASRPVDIANGLIEIRFTCDIFNCLPVMAHICGRIIKTLK